MTDSAALLTKPRALRAFDTLMVIKSMSSHRLKNGRIYPDFLGPFDYPIKFSILSLATDSKSG